jgi:fructose-1-phosphate kinase PfkB-like protein
MALETIAERGARNVLITLETGCFALVREGKRSRRYRAIAPQVEPVSAVGSGDVLLAQWIALVLERRPADEALRLAVAAGAASTVEIGAGRFDPREAARLAAAVEIRELQPVS